MSRMAIWIPVAVALCLSLACDKKRETPESRLPEASAPAPAADASRVETPAVPRHLAVDGTGFRRGSAPFEWRGITAFRLLEQLAHGRENEAIAYLDWARANRVNVVRVLTMAKHLFQL